MLTIREILCKLECYHIMGISTKNQQFSDILCPRSLGLTYFMNEHCMYSLWFCILKWGICEKMSYICMAMFMDECMIV